MTLTLGWTQITFLVGLFLIWNGFLIGVIRVLVISKIKTIEDSVQKNQAELAQMRVDMPVLYERREDAIRAYTVINAKLDRLYELLVGKKD